MALNDELEPKLTEIDRLAREMYEEYTLKRQKAMRVKPGTTVVERDYNDPRATTSGLDLAAEQRAYDTFRQSIIDLTRKFRTFYDLGEAAPFDAITDVLGKQPALPGKSALTRPEMPGMARPSVPASLSPGTVIGDLQTADAYWIRPADDNVAELISEDYWSGAAARDFEVFFLRGFQKANPRHCFYAQELGLAVITFREAVVKSQQDVLAIADVCIKHLSGAAHQGLSLEVVGVLVSVVGFVPGPVGLAADVAGLGIGLYSLFEQDSKNPPTAVNVDITGGLSGDARQVVNTTWNALVKLDKALSDLDESLSSALSKDLNDKRAFADPGLRLDRPDLADDAPPTLKGGTVRVELPRTYRAGYVNLPGAAACYGSAETKLSGCTIPSGLATFLPRSVEKFNESREGLAGILRSIRDSLHDTGENLVRAVKMYRSIDDDTAAKIRKMDPSFRPVQT